MDCPLCQKTEETRRSGHAHLVHEFPHSYLYLGDSQFHRGYCVQVTKEHFHEMTDIPSPHREAFFNELMATHRVMEKVFRPRKMNLCSLGNVVGHVHWHFFPRYVTEGDYLSPPSFSNPQDQVTTEERKELIKRLQEGFI